MLYAREYTQIQQCKYKGEPHIIILSNPTIIHDTHIQHHVVAYQTPLFQMIYCISIHFHLQMYIDVHHLSQHGGPYGAFPPASCPEDNWQNRPRHGIFVEASRNEMSVEYLQINHHDTYRLMGPRH